MNDKKIEALAKKGTPLPEGATLTESLFYRNLRALYKEFRDGNIDKLQARIEKNKLISQFGVEKLQEECNRISQERWFRCQPLLADVEKNGCEICKSIARILDGRG